MAEKAFILGLDGIPWYLIEQWTDEGELPNFARLREEGAAGPFESTHPATTPVAWPSIATGVRADKHGLYGFQELTHRHGHEMNTSADLDAPPMWERLDPAVVGNVPMTYPASEIDGTMVAGMMAPEMTEQFTHPPEFREELLEAVEDYRVSLPWMEYADEPDRFLDEFEGLVAARRELLQLLMERSEDWKLFFFVFTAPDRLQHLHWDEDVILDHYRELDAILGEVMDYVAQRDANLFVVSDHGFEPVEKFAHVNTLLEREGYLARAGSTGTRGVFDSFGVDRSTLTNALSKVGLDEDTLVSILPRSVVESVAQRVPGDHAMFDVDFDQTEAFFHFCGAVYVNDTERFDAGIVDPTDRDAVTDALLSVFESLTDPETGEHVLEVYDGRELFPEDDGSPDVILSGAEGYVTKNTLNDSIVSSSGNMAAGHGQEGVILAWGPSIEPGSEPADASVYDLLPTVFHSLGEPVPSNVDGRALTEIYREGSTAATQPVARTSYGDAGGADEQVDTDFEDVEARLKGLGYLG